MKKREWIDNEFVQLLSPSLQYKLQDGPAFIHACEKEMITFENGMWHSNFKCTSELSYFCSRCFCKDHTVGRKILRGNHDMPVRELEKMFRVKNLKSGIKYYRKNKISWNSKVIDNLLNKMS